MKITKAVIPAAGLGTRFLPVTKAMPKEMLPIIDKPTIQYIVEEAVNSGITDILIITGHNKKSIEDHFDRAIELELNLKKNNKHELFKMVDDITNLANIHYIRQKEPKGLGHAILCAKAFVGNDPFAILLGDDVVHAKKPALKQLIEQYNELNSSIIGVQEVEKEETCKYGILNGEKIDKSLYSVKGLVEKPLPDEAPSNIAILGRYVLTPKIFEILENTDVGKNGELQLTDALETLSLEEKVYSYIFEGKRYDIGDKFGFIQATIEYALKRGELKEKVLNYLKSIVRDS